MCRLLGYSSNKPASFDQVIGPDFKEFVKLADDHCDGWGIASNSSDLYREPVAATKSSHFKDEIAKHKSSGALLHLRWATPGLPVAEKNTHPFTYGDISFIHNGALLPGDQLDSKIPDHLKAKIVGDTDSERYFWFVISEIEKHGFIEGVKSALKFIKENTVYSSINCMIMNKETFIAACIYNQDKIPDRFKDQNDYYRLKYTERDGNVIVGSSGWNQAGWSELPNGSMLVVDRATQQFRVISTSNLPQ
jgi:predicted glutamine amidotransferase